MWNRTSELERLGLSVTDAMVASAALLLAVAFGPTMSYPSWTPRMAVVLACLPVGLVCLIRQARRDDWAARVGIGLIAWILLSGVTSEAPRSALVGFLGRDLSGLLVISCVALWALGRELSHRGVDVLVGALLAGLSLSVLVGLLQLLFDVRSGVFAMNGGRSSGFTPNPVYFGGVSAAGSAVAVWLGVRGLGRWYWWCVASAGWLAMGVALSGSRVALGALVLLVTAALLTLRRRGLVAVCSTIVGVAAGTLVQHVGGTSNDAVSRISSDGGLDGRRQIWGYGLRAVGDEWLTGWGFGRFQSAVQGRYTADFVVKYAQQDIGQAWFDAHNLVVGTAVAIGVPGLAIAGVWVVLAARRTRLALAIFPIALLVTWMMQPPALPTLPLAALMLGAAGRGWCVSLDREPSPARGMRAFSRVGTIVGLLLGAYLVVADQWFYRATEQLDASGSEAAAALFPGDPVVAGLVAQIWGLESGDSADPRAIDWQRQAVDRDRTRPYWWARLAERLLSANDNQAADRALDEALALQPYHFDSLRLKVVVAARSGDLTRLEAAIANACQVEAPECELNAAELLEDRADG